MTNQPKLFDDTNQLPIFSGTAPRAPEPAPFVPPASARQLALPYMIYNPYDHLSQSRQLTADEWARIKAQLTEADLADIENGGKVQIGKAARVWKSRLPEANGNGRGCAHYGRDVPEGWTGCSMCPATQECYMLWEARIEAANEKEEQEATVQ